MGKRGRSSQKKETKNTKTSTQYEDELSSDDIHDEIDAFHKQRDIVPLDINDDVGESDEDEEQPIFDFKGIDNDEDEDEDDDDYDNDDDDVNDNVAKIIRQRRYLRAKFGGGEDETHSDDDEDEEDDQPISGGKKFRHGADNRHFELQSSDDEAPKEEEEVALQIQRERAKFYTEEDYDLMAFSEDGGADAKLTLKEPSVKGKDTTKSPYRNLCLEHIDTTCMVEDLNALSKKEQMDVLYRSAPELVCWLSELNEAHKQLERKINPFLSKVKNGEIVLEGGVHYIELKQLLFLSYCQAITFYLLLMSEGKPVHDHPVIARLEEIKKLLDQIKQLDSTLPVELGVIVEENHGLETELKSSNEYASMTDSFTKDQELPFISAELLEAVVPQEAVEMQKVDSLKDNVNEARQHKHQEDLIGTQSLEMLKVRAFLEEKLKQKDFYSSIAPKSSTAQKRLKPVNGQLQTYDDFDDDAVDVGGAARLGNDLGSGTIAMFVNASRKKPKVVSGDDDLPKRDDIGERRRKHELRVLAGAGIKSEDEIGELGSNEVVDEVDDERGDSENELFKQMKQQKAAKLAAKDKTREPMPETVEGKRQISYQMEKNRGLTRNRKKLNKISRTKYKEKHRKAVKNRSGQVRGIRTPIGPYGGESSGINAAISRSVRFKS